MPQIGNKRSRIFSLLATTFWGTGNLIIKIAVETIPPITLSGLRALLGGLLLLLLLLIIEGIPRLSKTDFLWITLLGLLQPALTQGFFFMGIQHTDLSIASVIIATAPIQVVLIERLTMPAERLSNRKFIGLSLGFLGTVVVFVPELQTSNPDEITGLVLIFLASFTFALATILVRRISWHTTSLVITSIALLVGSIPALLLGLKFETANPILTDTNMLLMLAYIIVFVTAIAYLLWYKALSESTASNVAIFLFLIPLWGILLGVVVLKEEMSWNMLLGATMVVIGVIQVTRD